MNSSSPQPPGSIPESLGLPASGNTLVTAEDGSREALELSHDVLRILQQKPARAGGGNPAAVGFVGVRWVVEHGTTVWPNHHPTVLKRSENGWGMRRSRFWVKGHQTYCIGQLLLLIFTVNDHRPSFMRTLQENGLCFYILRKFVVWFVTCGTNDVCGRPQPQKKNIRSGGRCGRNYVKTQTSI